MATPRLDFDKTGIAPANYIPNEVHEITLGGVRVIALNEGSFYTKSLIVRRVSDGKLLVKGIDYNFTSIDIDVTALTAMEVAFGVGILDNTLNGALSFEYQAVGGYEGQGGFFYRQLADAIALAGANNLTWDMIDHPDTFPPEEHNHGIKTLTELEVVSQALSDLTHSFVNSHTLGLTGNQLDGRMKRMMSLIANIRDDVNSIVSSGEGGVDSGSVVTLSNSVTELTILNVEMMTRQLNMENRIIEVSDILVRLMSEIGSIMESSANKIDVE